MKEILKITIPLSYMTYKSEILERTLICNDTLLANVEGHPMKLHWNNSVLWKPDSLKRLNTVELYISSLMWKGMGTTDCVDKIKTLLFKN